MKKLPPRFALHFFRWYCRPRLRNYIEGDLIEVYNDRVRKIGKRSADWRFVVDVLLLFRPGIVRPIPRVRNVNTYAMYKNYFTIGWRNLTKGKGFSFINIGGLAMGMAVAMLIGLWIYDEISFNQYHKNYPRIAKVLRNGTLNSETFTSSYLPVPLAEELRSKYSGTFKSVVMAWPLGDHIISDDERNGNFRGQFIQPEGIEMLTLKVIEGSSRLDDPKSILLSSSAARNLFGNENAINKTVKIDSRMEAKVTGVYEDLPHNSDFHDVEFFAPWDLLVSVNEWIKFQNFGSNLLNIYVELAEGASFDIASQQIKDAVLNNVQDDKGYVAVNPQIFLHPMKDWHLRSEWKNGLNVGGLIEIVWLFGSIGVFVLLLACINFMNLSTARSEKRAKEVGVRKSMGSARSQLMFQFFSESFLVVVLSFTFTLGLVSMSLGWFNDLAGKQIELPWDSIYFWVISMSFILLTGLIAGSYPALYLSSFNAVKVLKGSLKAAKSASMPRKVLVVLQFTISVTLIIGTAMVYEQIQFAKSRPTGYSREGLLMIQMNSPEFGPKLETLRDELQNSGAVLDVAESSSPPTDIWNSNGGFEWRGKDPGFLIEFATMTVSANYGKVMGWEFLHGRDFSAELASDSAAFVINEAAAKVLGFDNPVGEVIRWNSVYRSKATSFTVIGVIRDMIIKSPYESAMPAVFFIGTDKNWINVKMNPAMNTSDAVSKMQAVFNKVMPAVPFDYKFVDDEYAFKFAAEERIGKLTSIFTFLAIAISFLGLFGLASFVAEQRTKEIGIRKVVGASVYNLWKMLSMDFILLVATACLVAIPLAYYLLSEWLQKFEYHTEVSWPVFGMTIIAALAVTLLTVSYQAIKAARMNPVKSLRSE